MKSTFSLSKEIAVELDVVAASVVDEDSVPAPRLSPTMPLLPSQAFVRCLWLSTLLSARRTTKCSENSGKMV